jgi:hypothetical protein
LPTIAEVGYIDAISFIQAANTQLPDQEKCAADAKQTFQQVESEYAAESKRIEIEVTSGTYASHYNTKIKQCFLSVKRSTSWAQETSITSYLLDTNQRLYAFYFETDGKMLTCTVRWSRLSEQIFRIDKWGVCRV